MSRAHSHSAGVRTRVLVAGGLAVALAAQLPVAAHADDQGAAVSPSQAPVELTQFTTENSQVMELPDGTRELTTYREPVRVEQGGAWVDVDTQLERRADGSIAAAATTVDARFSSGGTGPLVILRADDHLVEVGWDGALPAPELDGDTATYPAVRPGVDLVLTSTPTGYSKALVIRDAAAARDLVDNPARMTISGDDLTFTTKADGQIVAADDTGTVFTSSPAVMWDSGSRNVAGSEPSASDPGDSKVRPVNTETVTRGQRLEVTLAPPAAVLGDTSVQYPLYLDPVIDRSRLRYLTVHSRGWNYREDSGQPLRVGFCDWAECNDATQGTARSFFSLDISALTVAGVDPIIYDATVHARQIHNATSGAQPVNLTKATGFASTNSWPGPVGATLQTISSSGGYGNTSPATLNFSADAVKNYVQDSANAEDSTLQFSLSAPDSNNKNQWKKFANNPSITVRFGYPPTTPYDLGITGEVKCPGKPVYVPNATPQMFARSDERSAANYSLLYWFNIYQANTLVRNNTTAVSGASGARVSWTTTPALGQFTYGYRVQAKVNDPDVPNTATPFSLPYVFTVDTIRPSVPTVSSFSYPPEYWGAAQNAGGTFDFSSAADAAGFSWAIDTNTPPAVNSTTCNYNVTSANRLSGLVPASGGKGTLAVGANQLSEGRHTLTVRAFDGAHNPSDYSQTYVFYVSPTVAGSDGKNLQEFENLTATQPAGQTNVPVYNSAPSAVWSGDVLNSIVANQGSEASPTTVDYQFQVPVDGYYALGARLATAPHFGKLRFTVTEASDPGGDGRFPVLTPDRSGPLVVDTVSSATGSTYVPLGEYLPKEGLLLKKNKVYVLSVEVVGTNGSDFVYNGTYGGVAFDNYHDNGYSVGLDALTVAPLRSAEYENLSAAFDNQAVGSTTAAGFGLSANSTTSLSRAAMDQAGITPGQSVTVGGVSFEIPSSDQGKDNVISQGQSIAVAPTTGSNIYLLATSNCGPVTSAPGRQLTIGYRVQVDVDGDGKPVYENATSDQPVMQVPDWLSPPPAATASIPGRVTLAHYLNGSTQVTSGTPTLYVLNFPVDANYTNEQINRITLPRVGTTYTKAACGQPGTQSLRVFAMTVE